MFTALVNGVSLNPQRGRWPAVALIWIMATLIGLIVARLTKLGPVLLIVMPEHGVHVGDVVTFAACYLMAFDATLRIGG